MDNNVVGLIGTWIRDNFVMDFGTENPFKIEEESIEKGDRTTHSIFDGFGGRFLVGLEAKLGPKSGASSVRKAKKSLRRRGQKSIRKIVTQAYARQIPPVG